MKCPRDQTELVEATLGKHRCLRCPSCKGYFIKLTGSKVVGVDLTKLNPRVAANEFSQAEKTLTSPASGLAMKYFEYKGIKLDYCESTNSIWMDHREFERIISASNRQSHQKSKKEESLKESVILDGVGDGVVDFIGEAIFSLFD